jgi:hypothetical protein
VRGHRTRGTSPSAASTTVRGRFTPRAPTTRRQGRPVADAARSFACVPAAWCSPPPPTTPLLTAHHPLPTTHYPPPITRWSLPAGRCPPGARRSLPVARCPSLGARGPSLLHHGMTGRHARDGLRRDAGQPRHVRHRDRPHDWPPSPHVVLRQSLAARCSHAIERADVPACDRTDRSTKLGPEAIWLQPARLKSTVALALLVDVCVSARPTVNVAGENRSLGGRRRPGPQQASHELTVADRPHPPERASSAAPRPRRLTAGQIISSTDVFTMHGAQSWCRCGSGARRDVERVGPLREPIADPPSRPRRSTDRRPIGDEQNARDTDRSQLPWTAAASYRSFVPSLAHSATRSFARPFRPFALSPFRSFGRSLVRSFGRSLVRPVVCFTRHCARREHVKPTKGLGRARQRCQPCGEPRARRRGATDRTLDPSQRRPGPPAAVPRSQPARPG